MPSPRHILETQCVHAWDRNKKGHILVNLGQLEDENPINSMQI